MKVGVVSDVESSVFEAPLSLAAVMSGVLGAPGAAVSIVTARLPEATLVPLTVVAVAVRVWAPLANVELVIDQAPPGLATPVPTAVAPSYSVTVAPATAVPASVGA